ncbi:uncharacterized protein L969DRAFT_42854 [Mixia osmundae IAM 14324]|uniref:Uncharacterized protein n=1 Tax=Mixia osmundae (strain CBS 9802 / IAM 14324 / JCM 22182 / KY 12970) TaxID=764103 RepID=G7DT95_MIXOS|nr:uncharacterized protein L969DRAFT_42854 [Mixia osmundae IAM 14324]KEI42920.1 hypothetical protein L969DRAFT_42854 [Mixia osmundae IAM 14324]GAA93742.1 hypothetical protein E5Q_00388 [Mixia osmundae IAM 14324]
MGASSLLGVALCSGGNVLISVALNVQKLSHKRIEEQQDSASEHGHGSQPTTPSTSHSCRHDQPEELSDSTTLAPGSPKPAFVLARPSVQDLKPPVTSPSGHERGDPFFATRQEEQGDVQYVTPIIKLPSSPTADEDQISPKDHPQERPSHARGGKTYLRSKLWWLGLTLMAIGEASNFISYGLAPASLVAPLGSVALIANCFVAPLLLKETFRKQDIIGIGMSVIGVSTVVISSQSSEQKLSPDELKRAIRGVGFIVYAIVSLVLIGILSFLSTRPVADRWIIIDVGLCALIGGFTVLTTKAISSFLNIIFLDMFREWITYPILLILVLTAVAQVNYLQKALQRFDSREVVPTQFVCFTLSAIIGSAVLYRDFANADFQRVLNFCFGVGIVFGGVRVLTRSQEDENDAGRQRKSPTDNERNRLLEQGDHVGYLTTSAHGPTPPRSIRRRSSALALTGRRMLSSGYVLIAHSPTASNPGSLIQRDSFGQRTRRRSSLDARQNEFPWSNTRTKSSQRASAADEET